jgi:2-haloacid dehalogenase
VRAAEHDSAFSKPAGGLQSVEAVVFDIGGVLLDWDPRHLYRQLIEDEEVMERFLAEICTPEWHAQHDRGVSAERSCAKLAAAHPEHAELIRAWAGRSEEMVAGADPAAVEIVRELKAVGLPCYALTNMEAEAYPRRLERFPFLRLFDGIVVSGLEGVAKPDPEIFRRLLDRYGLTAGAAVMIDDSAANVAAARKLGMRTVRFESASQLRGWFSAAGLLER